MQFEVKITDLSLIENGVLNQERTANEIIEIITKALPFDSKVTNMANAHNWLSDNMMIILISTLNRDILTIEHQRLIGMEVGWNSIDTLKDIRDKLKQKKQELYDNEN